MSKTYHVSKYGGPPITQEREAADIHANDMLAMAATVLADVDDDLYTQLARRLRLLTVFGMSQDEAREILAYVTTTLSLLGPDCSKAGNTAIDVMSRLAAGEAGSTRKAG